MSEELEWEITFAVHVKQHVPFHDPPIKTREDGTEYKDDSPEFKERSKHHGRHITLLVKGATPDEAVESLQLQLLRNHASLR